MIPRSTELVSRRTGLYLLERYAQDDGRVSMQARGPMPREGGGVGIGDAAPGIIARVVAATDAEARRLLEERLVELGA